MGGFVWRFASNGRTTCIDAMPSYAQAFSRLPSSFACRRRAIRCGLRVKGKPAYRVPVRAEWGGMDAGVDSLWQHEEEAVVIASSPEEAASYWLAFWVARVARPCTVEAVGPKGGSAWRSAGWESVIGAQMFSGFVHDNQLVLNL